MKLHVEKGNLIQLLQKVQNITEKKTTLSILSNVMLKASEEQTLEFTATDLQMSFWSCTSAQVEIPGSTTVSARKFLEIVREIPGDTVTLETLPNDRLLILAGRSRFEQSTISSESFPHVTFYEDSDFVKCDAHAIRTAFEKTLYVVPMEEDPYSIAGLFWHPVEPDLYRFVSSDGHRLAFFELPRKVFSDIDVGTGVIVPRKAVQEASRLLEKETEALLSVHENCLIFKTADTLLSTQLLEGEFPEYEEIIPQDRPCSLTVDREILESALKRMLIFSNQKWRHVRFAISSGSLHLEAGNPEIGTADDFLDVDYAGEEFSVAFNTRYVMETVQVVEGSQVRFEWVDNYHGGVFVSSDDPGYVSLVMPMVI